MKIKNYINHVVFIIDKSTSMGPRMNNLQDQVVKVFDNQIKSLAQRSKDFDQETRVSVFLFADEENFECLAYDKDVLRLPSLKGYYKPDGNTALISATLKAISDLEKTPELYGDHSFLVYTITDGQNNRNRDLASSLRRKIESLPEHWTLGCLVPDNMGVRQAKEFGFPVNNIQVWSTTAGGLEKVGYNIEKATENYFRGRAAGVRGTKNLFSVDLGGVSKSTIKNTLSELSPNDYLLLPVHKDSVIKPFVESWTQESFPA